LYANTSKVGVIDSVTDSEIPSSKFEMHLEPWIGAINLDVHHIKL
jgi:hypothetical protein